VSPDVDPERLGLPDINLKQLWNDTRKLVDKFPIDSRAKEAIIKEAGQNLGIDTVDYEPVE
jgi:hypothetical protein